MMPYIDAHVDRRALDVAGDVLRELLDGFGFEAATITAGQDHDGEPVLFVDIKYRWGAPAIPRDVSFGLVRNLRDALLRVGEKRFPHVRHKIPDGRAVTG